MEVLNPPELHVMTGVVGKVLKGMETKSFGTGPEGEKFLNDFLKREDISRCCYQGNRSFEGNQARKLLKSVDIL